MISDLLVAEVRQYVRMWDVMPTAKCPLCASRKVEVSGNGEFWLCGSCKSGGDVITYTMQTRGLQWEDAVLQLRERFGARS